MPKNLVLLVGPSGSGKSTLAKEYEALFYDRISQDDQGKQEHIKKFLDHLKYEDDIVVDRLNFNKEQRNRYLKLAEDAGYTTKIIVLHENRDTCLQRCLKRENHPTIKDEVNAQSVLNTFFSKYERVEDDEADVVERRWPEGAKDTAIWVDMDNTLSDATHREHHLQGERKNWKAFFNDMDKDPVNPWCASIIDAMSKQHVILICSARPENYKIQTMEWLHKFFIPYNKLIMRPRNDCRRDDIVKEIIYEFEVKTRYNLLFSIDDRKQVIDRIRNHGVIVLDCAGEKGNF